MNWKLLIGQTLAKADDLLVKSDLHFVKNNYPYRRNWLFDLKRTTIDAQVIFDVGAYVGDVTVECSDWFPNAKIYSFEPINEAYNKLQQAIKGRTNISSFNSALGDKNETIVIPIYKEGSTNTLKNAQYNDAAKGTEEITVLRLDNFLSKHNITGIDILKIDVEGYELEVLKGIGSYLKNVKCIVTEVGYQRTNTKTHFADMERFMEDNGFELFNIYDLSPAYNDRTKLCYSNNVYINKTK